MALNAATTWNVMQAGSDLNGGAFVAGTGTDYSLVAGKRTSGSDISTTDAVANGTTTLTSATGNFSTALVGNIIYLAGGSGSLAAVRRQVATRASTTSITLDASVAAGTGITMNIGGALASPALPFAAITAGNTVNIKNDAGYTITSASTNVANGCISIATRCKVEGYLTTPGDGGTAPTLTASGISGATLLAVGTTDVVVRNLVLDCATLGTMKGYTNASRGQVTTVTVKNSTNGAFTGGAGTIFTRCRSTVHSSVAGFTTGIFICCVADAGTSTGFSTGSECRQCLAYNNSGASSDGFIATVTTTLFDGCVSYNNGQHGFNLSTFQGATVINSIAEGNAAGTGITGSGNAQMALNNGVYNNLATVSLTGGLSISEGLVTGTASFFVSASGGNFALNSSSGGGAGLRSQGVIGTTPDGLSLSYTDIGAIQSHPPMTNGAGYEGGMT